MTVGGRRRWTAPPGWPPPPAGWSPPVGWSPPPEWPAPPPGWDWWPAPAPSALRFHLVGAALLLAGLAGWWLVALVLSAATSACPPDPGNPGVLHAGVALAGLPAVLGCAWWSYRARRLGRCWQAWTALGVVCAAVLVDAAVTVRVAGCLFTF